MQSDIYSLWLRHLSTDRLVRVAVIVREGAVWYWAAYTIRGRRLKCGAGTDLLEQKRLAYAELYAWLSKKHRSPSR